MTQGMSKDIKLAYSRIQQVVKNAASPGVMRRDFVRAEKQEIENALVVLDVFAEEIGFRRGFRAALQEVAERDRFQQISYDDQLRYLLHIILEDNEVHLAEIFSHMPPDEVNSVRRAAVDVEDRRAGAE